MKPVSAMQMAAFFFSFSGRTPRREYIMGMAIIIFIQAAILDFALRRTANAMLATLPAGTILDEAAATELLFAAVGQVWLLLVILLAMTIAVGARRFQDFGLPGFFAAVLVFPFVNILAMIALAIIPGTPGPNRYGPQVRYV